MKKEKLLVKEIEVLKNVICDKVNKKRREILEKRMEKNKEYLSIKKKGEVLNKEIEKIKKMEEEIKESVDKLNKKIGGGYWNNSLGGVGMGGGFGYGRNRVDINLYFNNIDSELVYNKLMVGNIDGDLKVEDLIDRMVEEFSKV